MSNDVTLTPGTDRNLSSNDGAVQETNRDKALRGEVVKLTDDRLKEMQRQAIAHEGVAPLRTLHWHWAAMINELIALRSAHETRACVGCERGLPLDGHGHHYGRISNTGPLAPYYLDLTVCTSQKASE